LSVLKESAFRWWVPYTLRKRDMIISAVKAHVRKTTHKYGIEIPTRVEHAKRLDAQNGNNLWMKAFVNRLIHHAYEHKYLILIDV